MKRAFAPLAFLAATVALSAGISPSTVQAATYINYGPVGADGGFTITFGNTGITEANFTDVFDFAMPTGRGDFVITSTMSGGSQNITWTSVTFDGQQFESGAAGWNEFRFLNGVEISGAAGQQLVLSGLGGGNAAYSGVITFMPVAAVPEPAAWGLMILGFGSAGAILRRARRVTAA